MTSRPWPGAWSGTMRSTAVLAKMATSSTSGNSWRIASARPSVALMAFSQAMTATLPSESSEVVARWRKPSAMVGAMIFNTVGPTAVVITSASAMWASSASLSSAEFTPEKPVMVMSLGS